MKTSLSILLCTSIASAVLITSANAQFPNRFRHERFTEELYKQSLHDGASTQKNFKGLQTKNAPSICWQKCIGGKRDEYAQSVIKLSDGNYLTCGITNSHTGDFNATHGNYDAFLVKSNGEGNIVWEKTFGGSKDDVFYNATEMSNGDILAIGTTSSNDQQVSGNHGKPGTNDIWLVKTTSEGKFIKQHCFGGSGDEATALSVIVNKENNILFAAETNSVDGDVFNNHGDYDGWIVKLEPSFAIDWAVTVGDTAYDDMYNVYEVNSNFLVTGTKATVSSSFDGRLENYYDAHAALLDQSGNIVWYRIYGGSLSDDCNASVLTSDGNAVLTGHTSSTDGDVIGNNGFFNEWNWKIDVVHGGNIIWQNFFGGIATDTTAGFNIVETKDGGFVVVGGIGPSTTDFTTWDDYVAKVDANGNALWSERFGGSNFDILLGIAEESDGSILMAGATASNDGNMSGNHGGVEDVWLANLGGCENDFSSIPNEPATKILPPDNKKESISLWNSPNPFSQSTTISFTLLQSQKVSIQIFDKNGRLIKVLARAQMQAGAHQLVWDARDEKGNAVNTGVYFLKMQTGNYTKTKKLSLIK